MAAFAALEWGERGPLDTVLTGNDEPSRKGIAWACAGQLLATRNADLAGQVLVGLFDDLNPVVRKAAASVAANLRGRALQPFESILLALASSAAFNDAVPQLFLTLEHAPDEVGRLALRSAQRFVEVFGAAAGDIRTAAAGDVSHVADLVVRGLAQSRDSEERAALLDVVDELMKVGAYGVNDAVDSAGR